MAASYEARRYGVRSAMPVYQAKLKCPHLIVVPSHMGLYKEYSEKFMDFLHQYTTVIEKASIDEAYLDMTHYLGKRHPVEVAKEIQNRLYDELGLPCSIGIGANRFLAKMASDMKKPMGITVLRRRQVKEMIWPLSIYEMHGIGRKTAPKLVEVGVQTIGDLVKEENQVAVKEILGNQYRRFYLQALGYGSTTLDISRNHSFKSIGNSLTYSVPVVDQQTATHKLTELVETVVARLHNHQYLTRTLSVQIRYIDFKTQSRSITIDNPTNNGQLILTIIIQLFDELWNHQPIRLLGVSTTQLIEKKDYKEDINLFNYEEEATDELLIKTIHSIKRKFGDDVIKKGIKKKE